MFNAWCMWLYIVEPHVSCLVAEVGFFSFGDLASGKGAVALVGLLAAIAFCIIFVR
jgi:hypothetical protein